MAKKNMPKSKPRISEHTKSCLDISSTNPRVTPGPGTYEIDKSNTDHKKGLLGFIPKGERFV